MEQKSATRCYNCGKTGHIALKCIKPKREKGVCYTCGKMGHQVKKCPEKEKKSKKFSDQVLNVAEKVQQNDDFRRKMRYEKCGKRTLALRLNYN